MLPQYPVNHMQLAVVVQQTESTHTAGVQELRVSTQKVGTDAKYRVCNAVKGLHHSPVTLGRNAPSASEFQR